MRFILFWFFCLAELSAGKRILGFFPISGKSQHNVFAPILHGLAKRGHHVVYLTPIKPDFSHPNLNVRMMDSFLTKFREKVNITEARQKPVFYLSHILSKGAEDLAEYFYGNPAAQEIIHSSDKYDAVLMESYFVQEPVSALIHKFGCVAIEISALVDSAWINELAGLPDNPAYQIDFKTTLTDSLSFFERLYNTYVCWSTVLVSYYHLWKMQSIMDQYFNYTGWETRPPIHRLISNRSMILINRDVVMDYPYPLAPHVKDIGGINLLPNKPLPNDLQELMDASYEGVIYFSMGTHLKTSNLVSSETGKALVEVFGSLPQKVIMKWESEEIIKLPPNIKTYKWIPQQDVLAHKNCILFITHGGLLSLTESVFHGVPVVGIPMYADQPKNMMHVERYGYGVKIAAENITRESVTWAIQEVLGNPRYKEEVTRRSKMLKDNRHSGIEEALYWIEHAMKYPNALTPKAAELNFFQLHLIDINLFIIFTFFLAYLFICRTIQFVKTCFFKSVKEKQH